jgi:hypothetical protein
MTGSNRSGHRHAASLPLNLPLARGRFSAPAAGFHAVMPTMLSIMLIITLGRGLTVFGPAFRSALSTSSRISQPLAQGFQDGEPVRPSTLISPIFTTEVQRWTPSIQRWSKEYAIPADMIAVVMQIESCGDPLAISPSGAIGLFQVMPYHFSPEDDPLDVETNARRGLTYLSRGLALAADDPRLALAGYNGGHGVIGLPDSRWADETLRYVGWGVGILQDAAAGLKTSPRLTDWLDSGGRSLCRQAALDTPAAVLGDG